MPMSLMTFGHLYLIILLTPNTNKEKHMSNNKSNSSFLNDTLVFLTGVVLAAIIVIFSVANIMHYTAHLEADIASETLLSEVLYENNHIQPDTWIASTATRIIGPPLLASFIYPLTGYNLNLSMGIACTVMMLILCLCMLFFCRSIGLNWLQSLTAILIMFMLSSPSDETQRMLYLYANYYVAHFIPMFIILGLYARALKKRKLPVLFWIIGIVLAVINGIQGMHASMFVYLPLLGAELLRTLIFYIKKRRALKDTTLWAFVLSAICLVCAKIFGAYMSGGASRNIRHAPEKFMDVVLPNFLDVLPYSRLKWVVIGFIVLAVIGYVISFFHYNKSPELWSALPIVFGIIVVLLSATFTTAEVAPRYFVMQVFAVGIGCSILMRLFKYQNGFIVAILAVVYGAVSVTVFYDGLIASDNSESSAYYQIATWMESKGYEYGYSTFDHANTITVMSNNRVKVRGIDSFEKLNGIKWLTDATWYPPTKDTAGKTCYIVTKHTKDDFDTWLSENNPKIVDSQDIEGFTVYVLDKDYTVMNP